MIIHTLQSKGTGEKIIPRSFEPHVSDVKYTSHLWFLLLLLQMQRCLNMKMPTELDVQNVINEHELCHPRVKE